MRWPGSRMADSEAVDLAEFSGDESPLSVVFGRGLGVHREEDLELPYPPAWLHSAGPNADCLGAALVKSAGRGERTNFRLWSQDCCRISPALVP